MFKSIFKICWLPATSPKVEACDCFSTFGKGHLHFCDGTIDADASIHEACTLRFWSKICCRQDGIFFRWIAFFNRTMQNQILHILQSLRKKRIIGWSYSWNASPPAIEAKNPCLDELWEGMTTLQNDKICILMNDMKLDISLTVWFFFFKCNWAVFWRWLLAILFIYFFNLSSIGIWLGVS